MFSHILVATDGSERADRAIDTALRHAGDAAVTALMVVPDYTTHQFAEVVITNGPRFDELRARLAEEGRRRLGEVLARHGDAARRVQPLVAVGDQAYEQILQAAERLPCDLIVMASHGRPPVASALLGSQTQHVLSRAAVPVLVVT